MVNKAVLENKENFDLCLDFIWSSALFPEYSRLLRYFGIGELIKVRPPCSKRYYDSYVNNNQCCDTGRLANIRRNRIIRFQIEILKIVFAKRSILEGLKIRQSIN